MFGAISECARVTIPDEAMIFDASGLYVLVVQPDRTVKAGPINIYRDFGTPAEVRNGPSGGEELVVNPPADLSDGGKVHIATASRAVFF